MVNKRNMGKWVNALASGRFAQGSGALCRNQQYCCLGVACVVAMEDGVEMQVRHEPDDSKPADIVTYWDLSGWVMPEKVAEWLGVGEANPMLAGQEASWWNDSAALGFEGIAQLIKNEYQLNLSHLYPPVGS